ncbi:xanthorhodopsin [Phycisphaerae bacterium]|jgi:bacteriorhodopsin|nr:xanthorhodopsin [Phycisphaerae bacterium]
MLTLAVSDTATALRVGLSVEGVTLYLFWLGTVAMGAGALYFWLMMGTVAKSYRSVMVVAGIICAVACFHYFRMSAIYLEQVAGLFDAAGQRIAGKTITQFPTAYRYIDWLITVPLLVLEVPLLLRLGRKGTGLFRSLVLASIVMLVFAWIAEVSPVGGTSWWVNYLISCVAWFYIVYILFSQVSAQMQAQPESIVRALKGLRMFILVGWTIYPLGFLMALVGTQGESIREICYNIADVINKVGFGLVCYQGVRMASEGEADHSR